MASSDAMCNRLAVMGATVSRLLHVQRRVLPALQSEASYVRARLSDHIPTELQCSIDRLCELAREMRYCNVRTETEVSCLLGYYDPDGCDASEEFSAVVSDTQDSSTGLAPDVHLDPPRSSGPAPTTMPARPLRVVFQNVLENALLYTQDGGAVSLSCGHCGDYVELVVVNAPAFWLTEEELRRVFEPGMRGAEATVKSSRSQGMGLPLSQLLLEKHGGSIALSRQASASGELAVCCTIVLPASREAGTAQPALGPRC